MIEHCGSWIKQKPIKRSKYNYWVSMILSFICFHKRNDHLSEVSVAATATPTPTKQLLLSNECIRCTKAGKRNEWKWKTKSDFCLNRFSSCFVLCCCFHFSHVEWKTMRVVFGKTRNQIVNASEDLWNVWGEL